MTVPWRFFKGAQEGSAQMSSGTAGVPGSSPQPRHPASLLQAKVVVHEAYERSLTRPRGLFAPTCTPRGQPLSLQREAKCCQHHAP